MSTGRKDSHQKPLCSGISSLVDGVGHQAELNVGHKAQKCSLPLGLFLARQSRAVK